MRLPVFLLAVGLACPGAVPAGTSDRLDKLERRMEAVTELLLDVERLKSENADLRGQVELLKYELDQLKNQQRELYLDIERRLSGGGEAPAPAPSAPPPPSAPPAPAVASGGGGGVASADTEERAYQQAYALLIPQRRIPEAITALEAFVRQYPEGRYADNAQFWLGEAHYAAQAYGSAVTEFQRLVEAYPQSPKVPDALLKIGFIRHAQGDYDKAREVFEGLIRHYPDTAAARLADQRLSALPNTGR
jgi:tol-pal system protein YbgF